MNKALDNNLKQFIDLLLTNLRQFFIFILKFAFKICKCRICYFLVYLQIIKPYNPVFLIKNRLTLKLFQLSIIVKRHNLSSPLQKSCIDHRKSNSIFSIC